MTQVQGQSGRTVLGTEDHLLAQLRREGSTAQADLLATDSHHSVLESSRRGSRQKFAYSPYGFHPESTDFPGLPGFNGEARDAVTGHYFLGAGYRLYNVLLMRFQSADSWSPFGKGGLNSYLYCNADPINFTDPSGHSGLGMALTMVGNRRRTEAGIDSPANPASTVSARVVPSFSPPPDRSHLTRRTATPALTSGSLSPDYIGYHGSTDLDAKSLLAGLSALYLDSSSGLSSGRGFYVAPTREMAWDFAQIAAEYHPHSTARIFYVTARNFSGMIPNRSYHFGTMGEGGLDRIRQMGEMELVIREPAYRSIRIREITPERPLTRPRAAEAPF